MSVSLHDPVLMHLSDDITTLLARLICSHHHNELQRLKYVASRSQTHLYTQNQLQVLSLGFAQVQRGADLLRRAKPLPRPRSVVLLQRARTS